MYTLPWVSLAGTSLGTFLVSDLLISVYRHAMHETSTYDMLMMRDGMSIDVRCAAYLWYTNETERVSVYYKHALLTGNTNGCK